MDWDSDVAEGWLATGFESKDIRDKVLPLFLKVAKDRKPTKKEKKRGMVVEGGGEHMITEEEFVTKFVKATKIKAEDARALFKAADVDRSGMVDFKEFLTLMAALGSKGSADDKIALAFRVYDTDKSGKLDVREVKQMLMTLLAFADDASKEHKVNALTEQLLADAEAAARLQPADEDGVPAMDRDARSITLNELKSALATSDFVERYFGNVDVATSMVLGKKGDAPTSKLSECAAELFELMDLDKDGVITEAEGKHVAKLFECNPATFWTLLRKYDANNDKRISCDEFAAAINGRVLAAFFPGDGEDHMADQVTKVVDALRKDRQQTAKAA